MERPSLVVPAAAKRRAGTHTLAAVHAGGSRLSASLRPG